jgi:hypothetical protein
VPVGQPPDTGVLDAPRSMFRLPTQLAISLAVVLAACAPQQPESQPPSEGQELMTDSASGSASLVWSLQVERFADSVQFHLSVTNTSAEPLELTFPTGQSFDFAVMQNGREVWRWSADQMFTQAIRTEQLQPGQTQSYRATWVPPPGLSGEFTVRGTLTAQEHRVEQETQVRLP